MRNHSLLNKYSNMPIQVKAAIWFLVCSFFQKGIAVITTPIYTRLLNTSEYGQYNVFNSWLSIVMIITTLNLSAGTFSQGLVKFEEVRSEFISSFQGITVSLVLLWTIIYLLFHDFFNYIFSLSTIHILLMLLIAWTNSVFIFWASEQRVQYLYKRLVVITIISAILQPVICVILINLMNDKVTARILGIAISNIILYLWMFFFQLMEGKRFYSKRFWKYAISLNIPLLPHYLSQSILTGSDRIMISKLTDDSSAGIYGLAYSLSLIMTIFNTSLMNTLSPWMYQKLKIRKEIEIARIAYISIIMIAALNVGLIAIAPEIVSIFAPVEYIDAIWVIPPIAISSLFTFIYDLFSIFEFYYEKTKYISAATMICAIVNVILNYIFIKLFDYRAAGYTTLICYICYSIGHYWVMRKICNNILGGVIVFDSKILLLIGTTTMVTGFLLMATYRIAILRYFIISIFVVLILIFRKKIIKELSQLFPKSLRER